MPTPSQRKANYLRNLVKEREKLVASQEAELESLDNDLGGLSRELRQFRDIDFLEMAKQSGISKSYLSELERGIKPWNKEMLEKFLTVIRNN